MTSTKKKTHIDDRTAYLLLDRIDGDLRHQLDTFINPADGPTEQEDRKLAAKILVQAVRYITSYPVSE